MPSLWGWVSVQSPMMTYGYNDGYKRWQLSHLVFVIYYSHKYTEKTINKSLPSLNFGQRRLAPLRRVREEAAYEQDLSVSIQSPSDLV